MLVGMLQKKYLRALSLDSQGAGCGQGGTLGLMWALETPKVPPPVTLCQQFHTLSKSTATNPFQKVHQLWAMHANIRACMGEDSHSKPQ